MSINFELRHVSSWHIFSTHVILLPPLLFPMFTDYSWNRDRNHISFSLINKKFMYPVFLGHFLSPSYLDSLSLCLLLLLSVADQFNLCIGRFPPLLEILPTYTLGSNLPAWWLYLVSQPPTDSYNQSLFLFSNFQLMNSPFAAEILENYMVCFRDWAILKLCFQCDIHIVFSGFSCLS